MLWQLAVNNVRRNWSQSLLGIVGVAIAAGVLTASLSLGTGYPEGSYLEHRVFTGADVLLYPGHLGVGYEDAVVDDGSEWEWSLRRDRIFSDLRIFQPDLYEEGYIHPPDERTYFEADSLPEPLDEDRLQSEVVAVDPLLKIPANILVDGEEGEQRHQAPLRARNVAVDQKQWDVSQFVYRGRWLSKEDEGEFVALMQGPRGTASPTEGVRPTYEAPSTEDIITVEVPSLLGYSDGFPVYDWSEVKEVELEVVGLFSLPIGERPLMDEETGGYVYDSEGRQVMTTDYLETDDIFIPSTTWEEIWDKVSPEGIAPRAYQVNLVLEDMFAAESLSESLGEEMPGTTVRTIPTQVTIGRQSRGQAAIPADVSTMLVVAMFLVAGLLLVANMYVLIMQRRKEMAVLKAIGMSGPQVMGLILIEVLFIAIIGALLGFVSVRLLVTGVLLFSEVDALQIGLLTLQTGALVVTLSTAVAVVFGVLPAYLAMKQTTMEVLRDV